MISHQCNGALRELAPQCLDVNPTTTQRVKAEG